MVINFQQIRDDRLGFAARIVYSVLCTRQHFQKETPSVYELRKLLGFRHQTITAAMHDLTAYGYIIDGEVVEQSNPKYDKVYVNEGYNVKHQVFCQVVEAMRARATKNLSQCYWAKVFGISRRHAKNLTDAMAKGWEPNAEKSAQIFLKVTAPENRNIEEGSRVAT